VLIKNLYLIKGYGALKLMSEFPAKNWEKSSLNNLLKKLRDMGTVERKNGSARTTQNVSTVKELMLSQENQPNTHHSVRATSRETGIRQ